MNQIGFLVKQNDEERAENLKHNDKEKAENLKTRFWLNKYLYMDTTSLILSSDGANDLTSNKIKSDNISVLTSLLLAGNNILCSFSTLYTNINNINSL